MHVRALEFIFWRQTVLVVEGFTFLFNVLLVSKALRMITLTKELSGSEVHHQASMPRPLLEDPGAMKV